MNKPDDVVGHKTMRDGSHVPLLRQEADALMAECDRKEAKRAADMPDEQSAIDAMFQAWLRLKELGWKEAIYCPKDGTVFTVIEPGSTGIFDCHYEGQWPDGSWWLHDPDDGLCPSRPVLFKRKPE